MLFLLNGNYRSAIKRALFSSMADEKDTRWEATLLSVGISPFDSIVPGGVHVYVGYWGALGHVARARHAVCCCL